MLIILMTLFRKEIMIQKLFLEPALLKELNVEQQSLLIIAEQDKCQRYACVTWNARPKRHNRNRRHGVSKADSAAELTGHITD